MIKILGLCAFALAGPAFADPAAGGLSLVVGDGRVSPQSLSWPAQGTVWEEIRAGSPDPVEVTGDFSTTFELRSP